MTAPQTPARLRFLAVGLLPLAGLLVAACSSGSTATSTTTTAAPAGSTTTAPTTTAGPQVVVKTATVSGVGKVLVNAQGQVLYTFTDSSGAAVHCSSACLAAWPAVTPPPGVIAPAGSSGVGTLATTTTNGPAQVTLGGQPLYTFAGDSAPGVASGNNIVSFGGTWKVVKVQ